MNFHFHLLTRPVRRACNTLSVNELTIVCINLNCCRVVRGRIVKRQDEKMCICEGEIKIEQEEKVLDGERMLGRYRGFVSGR